MFSWRKASGRSEILYKYLKFGPVKEELDLECMALNSEISTVGGCLRQKLQ